MSIFFLMSPSIALFLSPKTGILWVPAFCGPDPVAKKTLAKNKQLMLRKKQFHYED